MNPVFRSVLRHLTAVLIAGALAWWMFFYVPATPSYAVVRLKLAVDARDGDAAAQYVDFDSVVRKAGYELVEKGATADAFGAVIGKTAVDLLSRPMAQALQAWAEREVDTGSKDVQIPAAAVAGAILIMRRDGDTASTQFTDPRGREWDIRMGRGGDGRWRITEVRNIEQLLRDLERRQRREPRPR
jgi:hypothetical protein